MCHPMMLTLYLLISVSPGLVWDRCVFVNETRKCVSKWQWGTVYNFLYKHGENAPLFMFLISHGLE
jgi:hypothetical protein